MRRETDKWARKLGGKPRPGTVALASTSGEYGPPVLFLYRKYTSLSRFANSFPRSNIRRIYQRENGNIFLFSPTIRLHGGKHTTRNVTAHKNNGFYRASPIIPRGQARVHDDYSSRTCHSWSFVIISFIIASRLLVSSTPPTRRPCPPPPWKLRHDLIS